MDTLNNLVYGLSQAMTLENIFYCLVGCTIGMFVGLVPGFTSVATISMLLPFVYELPTTGAIVMLAGVYYAAQYSDNISAITMKIPHPSSVIMCIDGHKMHLKDKTGLALFTAGFSSFWGGTISMFIICLLVPIIGSLALKIQPPEFVLIIICGFLFIAMTLNRSILQGMSLSAVGFVLGMIGYDITTGNERFTLGITELSDGLQLSYLAAGLFGVAEIIKNIEKHTGLSPYLGKKLKLLPSMLNFKRILKSASRGGLLGSLVGVLPGGGPTLSQYVAYAFEKKTSVHRKEIGKGTIEGVAAPASAEEASSRSGFIPLLTLGIPENAVMALIMSALIIKGITPGPNMISVHGDVFWPVIASMWIGNFILLIWNVPLVSWWFGILKIPYRVLWPCVLFFLCLGIYTIRNNVFDIYMIGFFGVIGYVLLKYKINPTAIIIGFVLGPILEEYFRRVYTVENGDLSVFFTRPICQVILLIIISSTVWFYVRNKNV